MLETVPPEQTLPNLDLLRSLAVLLVLASHLLAYLSPSAFHDGTANRVGHFGVLLFFVHTSLVLMMSLDRQAGSGIYRAFLIRRFFRIYPLAVFVVIATLAFQLPLGRVLPLQFQPAPWGFNTALQNLLLIQNLGQAPSIVGQLWSLPFEVQMYLVLPAIYLLLRRGQTRWLAASLWALGVVAAVGEKALTGQPGLLWYLPNFLSGVLAYHIWVKASSRIHWVWWVGCLAALLPAYLLLARYETEAGWLLCLFLGCLLPYFHQLPHSGLNQATSLIARYSYGIYLSHTFAIWVALHRIAGPPVLQWSVLSLLLLALPVLLYHGIEAPMIRIGKRLANRVSGGR